MAKQAKGKVEIRGRFSPGTTVELHERGSADLYAGGTGGKVASTKTNKDGVTAFEAPPGNYFAVATEKEWNHVLERHEDRQRVVDVTINRPTVEEDAPLPLGPEPPSPSYSPTAVGGQIIEGARGTHDLDPGTPTRVVDPRTGMVETFASAVVGEQHKAKDLPKHGVTPSPRMEDHQGEPLASSTLTGEAVPPMEQPPKQEDAKKNQKQASDTETGFQAPAREPVRQEDMQGVPQASDTQTGEAHPVGDPSQPRTSLTKEVPDSFKGPKGSGQPKQETRPAKGRAGSKKAAKKAASSAKKANRTPQAKAAKKKASGGAKTRDARKQARKGGGSTERSAADATARTAPATDARGVEHRSVPE
jgi:hypothetical protein